MEKTCLSRKLVCTSEPVSVEEITSVNIPLSLTMLVEQLPKDATRHDCLVALLLVLFVESGFCIIYDSDTEEQFSILQKACRNQYSLEVLQTKAVDGSCKIDDSSKSIDNPLPTVSNIECYKNIKCSNKFSHIPTNWKSKTDEYKIYFALPKFKNVPVKLIAVSMNDKGFFNISTWIGEKRIYNMSICTANFACPCPFQQCKCSDNFKIISYMMKDGLVTPTYIYILTSLGLPNPSLQGLPIELQRKVVGMLDTKDVISLAQCSRRFLQVCSEEWVWENMLARYFPTRYIKFTIEYNLCYQFRTWLRAMSQNTKGVTETALLEWFTSAQISKVKWHPIKMESITCQCPRSRTPYCWTHEHIRQVQFCGPSESLLSPPLLPRYHRNMDYVVHRNMRMHPTMALSRISTLDVLNVVTRISRTASLELQCATPAAVHQGQQRIETLHVTSVRRYPDPPRLGLPSNMRDVFGNETGRFTLERARDIALYSENGGITVTLANRTDFPRIHDDNHVGSYDCFGAVSLCGTMQTNVPKPYRSQGTHAWVLRSTHLNMPGGQWNRGSKYIAEDMQKSHYRNVRHESCTAINTFITSTLLRVTHRPMHSIRMSYSTDTSRPPESALKDQTVVAATVSKREKFRLLLRDYGGTMLVFHISISLISLGVCYMVVVSGVDVMPLVQKVTGGNEQMDKLMKTSTDFVIAYSVHKLLAPIRISTTVTVTPLLVRRLRKIGLLKMPKVKAPPP